MTTATTTAVLPRVRRRSELGLILFSAVTLRLSALLERRFARGIAEVKA